MNFPSYTSVFPEKGKFRLFIDKTPFIPNSEYRYNWIDHILQSRDRTLKEWLDLILEFQLPVFKESTFVVDTFQPPVYEFPNIPDLFFHRSVIATTIESLFYLNQRIRWIARKFVQRIRKRIMDKRIIGETDLVTLSTIPDKWSVCVYDVQTKSRYKFHINSIEKYMVESLFTTSFAYASPRSPKNPYTNLPWNLGQIIHIVDQIQTAYFTHRHKFCDTWLIRYRQMDYDLVEFEQEFNGPLQYKAAKAFFSDSANLLFAEVYREVIDDLFAQYEYPTNGCVYGMVMDRTLKKDLLLKWDEIVLYSFISANHNFFPPDAKYRTTDEIEEGLNKVYFETLYYVNKLRGPILIRGSGSFQPLE